MPDLDELDLRGEADPPPPDPPPDTGLRLAAIGVAAVVALVGLGGWLFFCRSPPPAATPSAPPVTSVPTPMPGPEAFGLPALDQSDAFIRDAAQGLGSHPLLGLWLGQQGIVRLVANVVDTVAKGDSPRASLGFLAPKGAFAVAQRPKQVLVADAASYARYDFFAEGAASLDAAAAAQVYRRALPLFEAAYRELGYPRGGFDAALREATGALLAVPVVQGELAVKPVRHGNVVVYECVDPALESLTPAQKHLLRMGPANVQRVQGALRAFLVALGA